jgi:hypothetical protein
VQRLHHDVAPLLVRLAHLFHALLRTLQGDDGSDLDRREAAVVVVALDARERVHQVLVADHEADPPAGHVVALRHREELDCDVACAGHLHDRRRPVVVEHDVGIREVVHDEDVVLFGDGDHPLEEAEIDALGGRVRRKTQYEHFGLRRELADGALELGEEIHAGRHAHRADIGAGDDRAVDVDRIRRIGHEHRVAALQAREHQVREAFLRADRDDGLAVHVELDAITPLIPGADRAAQPRNAFRYGIAVRVLAARSLHQLVDDVRRRGTVGVAHRQVDHVLAAPARRHLQLVGNVEDVRRKPLNP